MTSSVFRADVRQAASAAEIPWQEFKNATVLVTGATGLIGHALIHTLFVADRLHSLNLHLIAQGRNIEKGRALAQKCGAEFLNGDLRDPTLLSSLGSPVEYICHCAAVTDSARMVANPVEVIATAVDGTRAVLELARVKASKGMVHLSSMEVYGRTRPGQVSEADLGILDLTKPRSCYPESKRLCENLCASYWSEYGVPAKSGRLAQTFGAGCPRDDKRVFAQFARSVLMEKAIVLHTEGKSMNNCCYTSDAVRGLLLLLTRGGNGQAFNIANRAASMTIREMAEVVADQVSGGRISVVVDIPPDIANRGYAPDVAYILTTDKMRELGWQPSHGLVDMYKRLIADWREAAG